MEILVFIRDFILAILLSWIGADDAQAKENNAEQSKPAGVHLTSSCDRPGLILATQPVREQPVSQVEWFHS